MAFGPIISCFSVERDFSLALATDVTNLIRYSAIDYRNVRGRFLVQNLQIFFKKWTKKFVISDL